MSGGERQLLAFGNALIHSPKLVLFDEPFAGVDSGNSVIFADCIKRLNENGIAFVIVEHKKQRFDTLNNKEIELELEIIKPTAK